MKTKTSKIISLLIAVIMICVMVQAGVFTVSADTVNEENGFVYDYFYEVVDGNEKAVGAYVYDYTGNNSDVVIPDTLGGLPVKDIDFYGNKSITSVKIPNSVTDIVYCAFMGCSNLKSVGMPEKLEYIGESVFMGCKSLKEIKIPEGVTEIGYAAFADCTALEKVYLPSSLEMIDYAAFAIYNDGNPVALKDVYYSGTESQRKALEKASNDYYLQYNLVETCNEALWNATWHYNYNYSEKAQTQNDQKTETSSGDAKVDYRTDKGIKISDNKAFAAGTVVTAKQLTNGAIFEKAAAAMQGVSSKYQVFEFDATLSGATVQPNGKITVTFDLPDGYTADKLGLFYVKDGKIAEKIKINVDKANKTITAELEHFSTYVLAEVTSSKTWDYSSSNELNNKNYGIYVLFAGLIFTAFAVIALNKKKCK